VRGLGWRKSYACTSLHPLSSNMHGQAARATATQDCSAEGAGLRGAQTPQSIWARIQKDGAAGLRAALASWKPWVPPKQGQARAPGCASPSITGVQAGATAETAAVPPACTVRPGPPAITRCICGGRVIGWR